MLDYWPIYNNAVLAKLCLCILWVSNFSSHKDCGNITVSTWITAKAFAARLLLFLFIQSVRESEEGLTSLLLIVGCICMYLLQNALEAIAKWYLLIIALTLRTWFPREAKFLSYSCLPSVSCPTFSDRQNSEYLQVL